MKRRTFRSGRRSGPRPEAAPWSWPGGRRERPFPQAPPPGQEKRLTPASRIPLKATRRSRHDSSVWLLTEFGLLGLAAFLGLAAALVGKGVRAFRRASSMERPLVVGLIGAHFGMFGVSFGIEALYQRHWWLVMALLASSYAITRTRVHLPPDAGPACLGARI